MTLKDFLTPLVDYERTVQARVFMLVSAAAMVALAIVVLFRAVGVLLGMENPSALIGSLVGLLFFGGVISFAIRFRKYTQCAVIIAFCMGFVMFPYTFFASGNIYGAPLIWFLNYLLYINLVLKGRIKAVFLVASAILITVLFYLAYQFPELFVERTRDDIFLMAYGSIIVVGALISLQVSFGVSVFQEENKRSREQAKQIAELNAAQNHFFSSMSHEIRTPINTIIGLNEMILRDSTNDEVREDAENIQAASKMLLQVINDILDMSKFESGQMELTPTAYRTDYMLSDVVGMLWLRAKEKGLTFSVDVSPDMPQELYGDEVRIKQILINVLNNAIKYTDEGSVTLQIQCERLTGNTVKVIYTVSDTGVGIKKESIPYLFDAFKRVGQTENRYVEGTGLGLSVVKRLVDLMGGKVTVNSVYTQGSTFVVEIPQPVVSEQPVGEISAVYHRGADRRQAYHQSFEAPEARVLVVDDTASNLLVVKKLLRDTKVQLTTVESGSEALEKTLDTAFHVILMDHLMPEMDGIECLHRIRAQAGGHSAEAKIIALTANAGSDLKRLYAEAGFDGYLMKPVGGVELERELFHALPSELVHAIGTSDAITEESTAWISEHQKRIPVAITTESVADLPQSLREHYGIAIITHMVSTEDGVFRDGIELDTRGLLEYMEHDGAVMDRAPDAAAYETFFAEALQGANNIIHISITSKVEHSGCRTAMEAAEAFENVFVVDSGHLSCSQGLMALEACQMAKEGRTAAEILEGLNTTRKLISTSFIVDNVDYLVRANQLKAGLARIGKTFMMHPVIELKNGKMTVQKTFFGSSATAWESYVKWALSMPGRIDKRMLFIVHVGLSHRELEQIRSLVERKVHFEQVFIQEASPAIAVNCGPRAFALLFMRKNA